MATPITVRGRIETRPGVYSDIRSGIQNPPLAFPYGNVMIIDTGLGNGWAAGAGVNGSLSQNENSVYAFNNVQDFRDFIKGGYLWLIAEALFKPDGNRSNGVSTLYYTKAATTLHAEVAYTCTNGSFTIQTLDEGTGANGVLTSGNLGKGYACKLIAGVNDTAKYIVQFYVGTFHGLDAQNGNVPYDGITQAQAVPKLICQSAEVSTIQEFVNWAQDSQAFTENFKIKSGYVSGNFVAADLVTHAGFKLATGGTESYSATDFDTVLPVIKELDNFFFLTTDYGTANATSLSNSKLQDFIETQMKVQKYMVVGAGVVSSDLKGAATTKTEGIATYYDSDSVVVVHGGVKKKVRGVSGFRTYDSLYKAALALGRVCGLPPQVPGTLKTINIDGETHPLNENEQRFCLSKGILYSYYDYELQSFVLGQGINSLQNNTFLVNEDGTSFSIAVKRIATQLNWEIIYTAKRRFFGTNNGPNRATITKDDIKAWLETFLKTKVASSLEDNLIIRFGNINVTVNQDNYFVSYEFVPNFEVSKIVFTGIILDK